jgi:hypothetical protein
MNVMLVSCRHCHIILHTIIFQRRVLTFGLWVYTRWMNEIFDLGRLRGHSGFHSNCQCALLTLSYTTLKMHSSGLSQSNSSRNCWTNLFPPTLRQDHILLCPQGLLISYVNLPRALHNPSSRMPVAIVCVQAHWRTYLTLCYPQSLNYVTWPKLRVMDVHTQQFHCGHLWSSPWHLQFRKISVYC